MNQAESTLGARIGEVLSDRYEVLRKIGEGGMGEVYEVRHTTLERVFAMKLLHPELARSQRMLRRFSREALAASRLSSDHIVSVLDCGHTPEGIPYFVMERLRGSNLRGVLQRERHLPLPRAIRIAIDVCRGLHVAHSAGLVHRDLKPENLFLVRGDDGQESTKLLDFGLVLGAEGTTLSTQPGGVAGTTRYMAPEQLRGVVVDARADLYALGVVLYECLAGQVPHPGDSAEAIMFHILHQPARPLGEVRAELPAGLCAAVHRALHNEASERYGSAQSLADALLPYAGETLPRVGALPAIELGEPSVSGAEASTTRDDVRLDGPTRSTAPARTATPSRSVASGRSSWLPAAAIAIAGVSAGALLRGPVESARPEQSAPARAVAPTAPSEPITPALVKDPPSSLPKPSASSEPRSLPPARLPARGSVGARASGAAEADSVFDSDNPYNRAQP